MYSRVGLIFLWKYYSDTENEACAHRYFILCYMCSEQPCFCLPGFSPLKLKERLIVFLFFFVSFYLRDKKAANKTLSKMCWRVLKWECNRICLILLLSTVQKPAGLQQYAVDFAGLLFQLVNSVNLPPDGDRLTLCTWALTQPAGFRFQTLAWRFRSLCWTLELLQMLPL